MEKTSIVDFISFEKNHNSISYALVKYSNFKAPTGHKILKFENFKLRKEVIVSREVFHQMNFEEKIKLVFLDQRLYLLVTNRKILALYRLSKSENKLDFVKNADISIALYCKNLLETLKISSRY